MTQQTVYSELVSQDELARLNPKLTEPLGVKQFKDFHLKTPQMYETHVKDKIFFIGQNALQGTDATMEQQVALSKQHRPN